jgi:uncharacterized protein YjbJ (UPF0337 family)
MRSAQQDTARGGIDKVAGRMLEAVGKVTGNRKTRMKGKAAQGRGAVRSTKGRLKRHGGGVGLFGGLGGIVGGLLRVVGGLLGGVVGLLKGVLVGVGTLLRRLL